jgi:hypothetical protein
MIPDTLEALIMRDGILILQVFAVFSEIALKKI